MKLLTLKFTVFFLAILPGLFLALSSCNDQPAEKSKAAVLLHEQKKNEKTFIIRGKDEPVAADSVQQGKVLLSYSDCYTCHRGNTKTRGPAFSAVALRYPMNEVFIDILALKVMQGGSGAWGSAAMLPHPELSRSEARAMVMYILSLDQ